MLPSRRPVASPTRSSHAKVAATWVASLSRRPPNEENEKMPPRVIYSNSWSAPLPSWKSGDATAGTVMDAMSATYNRQTHN